MRFLFLKNNYIYKVIFSCIFASLFFAVHVFAQITEEDLQRQIDERQAEIAKLEAEIAAYQNTLESQSEISDTLENEITRIETIINKLNADIRLTRHKIAETEEEIISLQEESELRQAKIDGQRIILAELVRNVHENDDLSIIEVLLAYGSISEYFDERDITESLQKRLEIELSTLRAQKAELLTQKELTEAEEAELKAFQSDLSGKKNAQESVNKQKTALLDESESKEEEYQRILQEREKRRKEVQNEIQAIEDELRLLIDPSLLPEKRPGVLSWPVDNVLITQGFGFTEFARTYGSDVYRGSGHNGIDLQASIGTRIRSASAGIVRSVGNTDQICPGGSYGRYIVVEHPNNLSTLYAHLSSTLVGPGEIIERGDIIGYSGNSGFVTGPHLHFTVYATNTFRLHQTRNCGLIPAGGYLDPLEYL